MTRSFQMLYIRFSAKMQGDWWPVYGNRHYFPASGNGSLSAPWWCTTDCSGCPWHIPLHIRAGFLVSRVTQDTAMLHFASHTGLSPSMVTFSKVFCSRFAYNVAVLQPRWRLATSTVWAVPRSLATTRGIIHLFSLPTGTKMFQFPALALTLKC